MKPAKNKRHISPYSINSVNAESKQTNDSESSRQKKMPNIVQYSHSRFVILITNTLICHIIFAPFSLVARFCSYFCTEFSFKNRIRKKLKTTREKKSSFCCFFSGSLLPDHVPRTGFPWRHWQHNGISETTSRHRWNVGLHPEVRCKRARIHLCVTADRRHSARI